VAAVRAEQVDILVDLAGFTGGGRSGNRGAALAYRLARFRSIIRQPTGARFFDYIVSDHVVVPERLRPFYREKVVRLPDCCLPTTPARRLPPANGSSVEGLPPDAFVFCCFNTIHKVQPRCSTCGCVCSIACRTACCGCARTTTPSSQPAPRGASRGIAPDRLVFAERKPMRSTGPAPVGRSFSRYFPVGAQTTAGIRCSPDCRSCRSARKLLLAGEHQPVAGGGLPELCVDSLEAYEQLALKLAREPGLLTKFREQLQAARHARPLFDSERYRRHLETATSSCTSAAWRAKPRPTSTSAVGSDDDVDDAVGHDDHALGVWPSSARTIRARRAPLLGRILGASLGRASVPRSLPLS